AKFGGAEGDRTPDLMTASHALSQLSYGPKPLTEIAASLGASNNRGDFIPIQSAILFERYGSKNFTQSLSSTKFSIEDRAEQSDLRPSCCRRLRCFAIRKRLL